MRSERGSTDPRGASPPYAPPLPDRPGPEGITLQVPGRSTMDGAYDAESSTDHRRIQAYDQFLIRERRADMAGGFTEEENDEAHDARGGCGGRRTRPVHSGRGDFTSVYKDGDTRQLRGAGLRAAVLRDVHRADPELRRHPARRQRGVPARADGRQPGR